MTSKSNEQELRDKVNEIIEMWDFSPFQDEDSRIERVQNEILTLIQSATTEARNDLVEALEALGDMYGQYCSDKYGHDFMSAGENAIDVLEKWGLAKENQEFDWDMFEKGIESLQNNKDKKS